MPSKLDFRAKRSVGESGSVSASGEEPGKAGRPPRRWYQFRRPDGGAEVVVAPKRPGQRRLVTAQTITASVQET
jgi:hypothetical protein